MLDQKDCQISLVAAAPSKAKLILYHIRLGHLPFSRLKHLFPCSYEACNKTKLVCDAYKLVKHTRNS